MINLILLIIIPQLIYHTFPKYDIQNTDTQNSWLKGIKC